MITNTENFFDELNEDNEEIPVDISQSKRKNIHFETPTRRVGDIYHSYNTNELDPRPPFQRGYVWDKKKASRLVESILLNVPIPLIYTSQEEDSSELKPLKCTRCNESLSPNSYFCSKCALPINLRDQYLQEKDAAESGLKECSN